MSVRLAHAAPEPLTGSAYLGLCRRASGMSERDAALLYAAAPASVGGAELCLTLAETSDDYPLSPEMAARFAAVFRFDVELYLDLLAGLPTRSVCRACGWDWQRMLERSAAPVRTWADASETLCTACARQVPA